jgi:hypothetical protein
MQTLSVPPHWSPLAGVPFRLKEKGIFLPWKVGVTSESKF